MRIPIHCRRVLLLVGLASAALMVSSAIANIPKETKPTPGKVISVTEQWRRQLSSGEPTIDVDACREAALNGNPNAQFNMGLLYEEGIRLPKNRHEALNWYRKAADQGLPI